MRTKRSMSSLAAAIALGLVAVACGNGGSSVVSPRPPATSAPAGHETSPMATLSPSSKPGESPVPVESAVPVESNPPGDIPDSTQFVPFRSAAGGFEIKAPEGWARRTTGSTVTFTSKLNGISASWRQTSTPPSPDAVKRSEAPQLRRTFRAFRIVSAKGVSLPGGAAVQLDFHANSEPNSVTGKQYRLDVLRFDFFRNGREVSLDLSSPVGSDNVDAWRLISESFRWR